MLWACVAAIPKLLTASLASGTELIELNTSEATETSKIFELSSVQRESSGSNDDLNLQEWPSVRSLLTGSLFSEAMSDRVTTGQQRKEEHDAMVPLRHRSPVSEELI